LTKTDEKNITITSKIELNEFFAVHEHKETGFSIFAYQISTHNKFKHTFVCRDKENRNKWVFLLKKTIFSVEENLRERRVVVLMNPNSGNKKSLKKFNDKVKPIFSVSHLNYKIIQSEKAGHIVELAKNLDFNTTDEIIGIY
jgi:hypothetical protein